MLTQGGVDNFAIFPWIDNAQFCRRRAALLYSLPGSALLQPAKGLCHCSSMFSFVFQVDIIWMPNSGTDHCSPVSPQCPQNVIFWCISAKPSVVISRGVESKWQNLRGGYGGNQKRSCCVCSHPWECSKAGVDKNWIWPLMFWLPTLSPPEILCVYWGLYGEGFSWASGDIRTSRGSWRKTAMKPYLDQSWVSLVFRSAGTSEWRKKITSMVLWLKR